MAEPGSQTPDEQREQFEREEGEVLERDQEHKGYGEDEGERDEALPDEPGGE